MNIPPVMILKHGTASQSDIALCRKAGIIVMMVKDPSDVRYMDPPLMPVTRLSSVAVRLLKQLHGDPNCYASLKKETLIKELAEVFMNDVQPDEPDRDKP